MTRTATQTSKGTNGHSGQTNQQFGSSPTMQSRQQRDQRVRSQLFANHGTTRGQSWKSSKEELTASSQTSFDLLNQLKFRGLVPFAELTCIPTKINSKFLDSQTEQITGPVEVPDGTIHALVVPSIPRLMTPSQFQTLISSGGPEAQSENEDFETVYRDSTYGPNPTYFHHIFGISPGERVERTSIQRQTVALEQAGKKVLTDTETKMFILAMINSGQGPKIGETQIFVSGGSMLPGSEAIVPATYVTNFGNGKYQIWTNFFGNVGSILRGAYLPWCTGRSFGHGSGN